jgi:hypothetical protein
LVGKGLELRGYGAIMSQTIAGGLATSLHGEHTSSSFGDHLVGLVAITADGSTIEVDDDTRFAWVGATGELGVVVEATLRVWPTSRVLCDRQYGSNDDVESVLYDLSVYMTSIDTIIEDGSGGEQLPRPYPKPYHSNTPKHLSTKNTHASSFGHLRRGSLSQLQFGKLASCSTAIKKLGIKKFYNSI